MSSFVPHLKAVTKPGRTTATKLFLYAFVPYASFTTTLTAMQISSQTKKPIRVVRGYKLHSEYAPVEGYRYDGLYTVEQASISSAQAYYVE